ncbi:hypothetical protein MYCGRDRAFT_35527 [Paecilomyces variotii No. 5]|uniref:Phospholipase n=1 Tax=Byssochlamys spectabilis (strain No. 5 / NBRC 109023) TaxID=1356009 RepID=V5FIC8_BYSSN|nr:hypothetical protein MYCGRDRAFT_35527 [Paecilomyces variotii No. 5]
MPELYEPEYQAEPQQEGLMSRIIDSVGETVIGSDDKKEEDASPEDEVAASNTSHRYDSFAPERGSNQVKWHVDGCNYFHAVSIALEQAKETIWILDWWLSPELYLRRPPAKNEQYRVDRMLQAAAERGVHVNIIVYKEVTQALTLSSEHTKQHLESLHPNIRVFRHPDHVPDEKEVADSVLSKLKGLVLDTAKLSNMSNDEVKQIYGSKEETVLYWAHHEKLCLIDGKIAFMGGLDMCFGRWDTNQHGIADFHPANLDEIVYPGQDYNNARVLDFQDVAHWEQNQLDRKATPRMGWSDISVSLRGPVVEDLRRHFVERWNFIWKTKYNADHEDNRYSRLTLHREPASGGLEGNTSNEQGWSLSGFGHALHDQFHHYIGGGHHSSSGAGSFKCQIVRSCSQWSHGVPTEHSIANAYAAIIRDSKHFVYIENQFFITATGDDQKPVENTIGAAIVERILRAARAGEKYKVIVVIPSVPAFAGDLMDDSALGTRAIMEFQYNSINRGGNSIMELISKEGYDPVDYIRFFNLRNYDRINAGGAASRIERESGVDYEDARKQQDIATAGYGGYGPGASNDDVETSGSYEQYQETAQQSSAGSRWDSVSECYMLGGEDIRNVPWDNSGDMDEIDAFVSEELYVLIADDRVVICGSANLNDRSQLGTHDSEIAIIIEDSTPYETTMDGRPWTASRFATSLRRQLFRKHLGLLRAQDCTRLNANAEPVGVPNDDDLDSEESQLVADPLSDEFQDLWISRAHTNTEVYREVFHPVPDDTVRNWDTYKEFFEKYFHKAVENADGEEGLLEKPAKYQWAHVVRENFPEGPEGARQVKELLSKVKGTLVEMPLVFLVEEDVAKTGLSLNAVTEPIYT